MSLALETVPAVMRPRRVLPWGLAAVAILVVYAVFVPLVAPAAWLDVDLHATRSTPSLVHWFGTDNAGRDLFVRIALGLRVSLLIAVICAVVSTVLGVLIGGIAAALGGWADAALMRISDSVNALPHLLLGIVIVAFFPGKLLAIIASIALTHWPQVARLVRSVALTTRTMEYVEAAYLGGATRMQVFIRHIMPSTLGQALVAVVLLLPHAIWHESTLSFLGLGLSPDQASLGTLLEISRAEVLIGGWHTLMFPAAALVVTTLAVASLGKALTARVPGAAGMEIS